MISCTACQRRESSKQGHTKNPSSEPPRRNSSTEGLRLLMVPTDRHNAVAQPFGLLHSHPLIADQRRGFRRHQATEGHGTRQVTGDG